MALRIILPSSSSKACSSKRQEVPSPPPDEALRVFGEAARFRHGRAAYFFYGFFFHDTVYTVRRYSQK